MGPTPATGGCTFAEDPAIAAPQARLLWRADLDPGTLIVEAAQARPADRDAIDPIEFARWLTLMRGPAGFEHAVLSNGRHHIRFDVVAGTLAEGPVILHYQLHGTVSARDRLLPLRRLIAFSLHRSFPSTLYPLDSRIERGLVTLRVADALAAGASHREIGIALFGEDRVLAEWEGGSDSLRSRVRRLAAQARRLGQGGWRALLGGG